MSLVLAGKITWFACVVIWFALRQPHRRRARRARISDDRMRADEWARLAVSTTGMGVIPMIYVFTDFPPQANYAASWVLFIPGLAAAAGALILFRLTHKALGKMWSVSLQLKEDHKLVTDGIYRTLRHPMYSAFWLMALAQALLLPNLVAGLSGLIGFGILFALRIGPEERMMEAAFGDAYREYRARTWRVVPYIY